MSSHDDHSYLPGAGRSRGRVRPSEAAKLHRLWQRGRWCATAGGHIVDLDDPAPSTIDLEDIAHHLSLLCRFGGACREFYSFAQHSVHVSHLVPPKVALEGLLCDAAKAYIGNVIQPIKSDLGMLQRMEARLYAVIARRFGLATTTIPEAVKHADHRMLATERAQLMPDRPWPGDQDGNSPAADRPLVNMRLEPLVPKMARRMFLRRYEDLTIRSGGD